eukprot:scaffold621812_cov38-Prasinocladus_malaysianus.AAC.1
MFSQPTQRGCFESEEGSEPVHGVQDPRDNEAMLPQYTAASLRVRLLAFHWRLNRAIPHHLEEV